MVWVIHQMSEGPRHVSAIDPSDRDEVSSSLQVTQIRELSTCRGTHTRSSFGAVAAGTRNTHTLLRPEMPTKPHTTQPAIICVAKVSAGWFGYASACLATEAHRRCCFTPGGNNAHDGWADRPQGTRGTQNDPDEAPAEAASARLLCQREQRQQP